MTGPLSEGLFGLAVGKWQQRLAQNGGRNPELFEAYPEQPWDICSNRRSGLASFTRQTRKE
jgi:hypothetical protein